MKRVTLLVISIALVVILIAGCGGASSGSQTNGAQSTVTTNTPATSTPTESGSNIKVALAADQGGINDKSINEAANRGMKKAAGELGVGYKVIESKTNDDYEPSLNALAADNSNLIIGIGQQMATAMGNVAKRNPKTYFVIVDTEVKEPNVQSIAFKENEGSFLVGVIAGKMTKTNKVGFLGGMDLEVIDRFLAGYAAGVASVNPEAAKGLIGKDAKTAGTMVKYANSFNDVNKGYDIGKAMYADGCDVVYHAAAGVGIGLFKAAKDNSEKGSKVWAIGVDMDQASALPEYKQFILTSMIKNVDVAAYNAVKQVKDGTFKAGTTVTLGLKENGLILPDNTADNTPKEVLDIVEKYKKAIIDGTITVPASKEQLINFKPTRIN